MGFLGRESEAERRRIERFKLWLDGCSKPALLSVCAGMFAVVEFWTMVLGAAAGAAAIVLGVVGRREASTSPTLRGRRLALLGILLGTVGIGLSTFMWLQGYALLEAWRG